ncbi:hypothetical protein WP50_06950, partial [Lactiplantibacillus plantarum]
TYLLAKRDIRMNILVHMGENITTETIMGSGASPSIHANDLELLVSGIFSIAPNLRSTIMSTTIVSIAIITVPNCAMFRS